MAKLINCECGFVARGESESDVIESIRDHIGADHPELLDKVSREEMVGWIEEA